MWSWEEKSTTKAELNGTWNSFWRRSFNAFRSPLTLPPPASLSHTGPFRTARYTSPLEQVYYGTGSRRMILLCSRDGFGTLRSLFFDPKSAFPIKRIVPRPSLVRSPCPLKSNSLYFTQLALRDEDCLARTPRLRRLIKQCLGARRDFCSRLVSTTIRATDAYNVCLSPTL